MIKFNKTYSNTIGRKFIRFSVSDDRRVRTYDICVRKERRGMEIMSRAQAKARAQFLFSMGDEIESMTQQLVRRYRQFGESELVRCFHIALDAGLHARFVKWMIEINDPLASQPGSPEWRFCEYVKREAKNWA